MNLTILNGLFSGLAALAALISLILTCIFSLPCYIKRKFCNKAFRKINEFYEKYSYLTLAYAQNIKEINKKITNQLLQQYVFAFGFPLCKITFWENLYNFNPFSFQTTDFISTLTIKESWMFLNFWKKINKKIKYIARILNQFDLITENLELGIYQYRDTFCNSEIQAVSISFSSFDELKLFHAQSVLHTTINQKNINLNKLLKKLEERKKRHQLIKEIKNKEFSLNIEFKNPYNDEQQNFSSFPYSIEFKNGKITKIDTFFTHWKRYYLTKSDFQEWEKHKNWLEKIFCIKIGSYIKEPCINQHCNRL